MRQIAGVLTGLFAIVLIVWFSGSGPAAPLLHAPAVVEQPAPPAPTPAPPVPVVTRRPVPTPPLPVPAPPEPGLDREICADLDAVGKTFMQEQALADPVIACLDARILDDDEAENVLRLLTIHAYNTDRALWARRSVQLASMTVDPDLHYKLAVYFAEDGQPEVALHHVEVTLAEAHVWDEATAQKRTDVLEKVRTSLCGELEDASEYSICD